MADFKYEILKEIGVLSEKNSGWKKELNFVKWGDNEAKFDIREWAPDKSKMGRGVTFTRDELVVLKDLIEYALEEDTE